MYRLTEEVANMFYDFIIQNNISSDLEEILKEDIIQDLDKIVKKIEGWEKIVKGNK